MLVAERVDIRFHFENPIENLKHVARVLPSQFADHVKQRVAVAFDTGSSDGGFLIDVRLKMLDEQIEVSQRHYAPLNERLELRVVARRTIRYVANLRYDQI